jgi:hypothetical protein
MSRKQDEPQKRKSKPATPSTGCGAASALDALIKRRLAAPAHGVQPPPPQSKKH